MRGFQLLRPRRLKAVVAFAVTAFVLLVTIGGLNGLGWWLGNIERGGWWTVTFRVKVVGAAVVAEGVTANNLGKLAGENAFGQRYSERDGGEVAYVEQALVLTKTAVSVPSALLPGSSVQYQVTIDNTGGAAARDILVTDTLPVGMRLHDPTSGPTSVTLDGSPVVEGVDFVESYDSGTRVVTWDLQAVAVSTVIPAGGMLVITYTSQVDPGVGAGTVLTDLATVSWNVQADGSGRVYRGLPTPPIPTPLRGVRPGHRTDGSEKRSELKARTRPRTCALRLVEDPGRGIPLRLENLKRWAVVLP